jgi:hypothetical protein
LAATFSRYQRKIVSGVADLALAHGSGALRTTEGDGDVVNHEIEMHRVQCRRYVRTAEALGAAVESPAFASR